jgi:hypothetical protein
MNGQWIGPYFGTNTGMLVVELDDAGGQYEGSVLAIDNNSTLPSILGEFVAPKGESEFKVRIPLTTVERATANPFAEEVFAAKHPGVVRAKYADAEWKVGDSEMVVSWATDIGTNGSAVIKRSEGGKKSKLVATEMTWEEFKKYATALQPTRFLFRGQENNEWKLRTAFHRTGRANLLKFMRQDVGACIDTL